MFFKKRSGAGLCPQEGQKRLCFEIALAAGLVLALGLAASWGRFAALCGAVQRDTLRLHVVAASNTVQDQYIKLQVKDAVLKECGALFAQSEDINEAHSRAAAGLGKLKLTAAEAAARAGFEGKVEVRLTRMYFPTRQYEGFALPAGQYRAVRVELGEHRGANWWCVLYPGLCLPGCTAEYPNAAQQQLITGGYEVRFALWEAWQRLCGQMGK